MKRTIIGGLALAVVALAGGSMEFADRDECSVAGDAVAPRVDTVTDLRLMLNVPAYRLDVFEDGALTRSIRVAVGQPKYRTPIGHFRIDYAVWNPWWRPPASEWARKERPMAPGWANPVGRVKLHVTGLVFLHGTPNEASRGSAASHACVRLSNEDAIALARVVHAHAGPAIPDHLLDQLVADTAKTRTLVLSHAVPIDIEYALAEIRGEELWLYADVYRYGGRRVPSMEAQALAALRGAVGDSAMIDTVRLRATMKSARRGTASVAVDSLVVPLR